MVVGYHILLGSTVEISTPASQVNYECKQNLKAIV